METVKHTPGMKKQPERKSKMSDIKDGGAAFPAIHSLSDGVSYANGMTLRDYFAGQALHGILYSNNFFYKNKLYQEAYELAYIMSDAMLEERAK